MSESPRDVLRFTYCIVKSSNLASKNGREKYKQPANFTVLSLSSHHKPKRIETFVYGFL